MKARVTPSTPFEAWPLYMTVEEYAIVAGRSPKALRNGISAGRIWPPPIADEFGFVTPYRFHRDHIRRAMSGELPRPRRQLLRPRLAARRTA